MHIEAGEAFKMNANHVPLRKSVEEIRLGKDSEGVRRLRRGAVRLK